MGLLKRIFSKTSPPTSSSVEASLYIGNETLEVVGESHHQEVLWRIVGGRRSDRVRYETLAVLMPEPDNPSDPDAIKILIAGNHVGYLSREDAAAYRPGLLRLMDKSVNQLVGLQASIVGGGQQQDRLGFLGVFLDHDPTDFGVASQPPGNAVGFRTGFSEAAATDLEDDKYDLSWYQELSDDDLTAIMQLRSMLEVDPDPIDRHYMMSELERRLYRNRETFSSALDEFDAVCREHDAEMATIRPALLAKFGKMPLIDTYRQAAVRCQKARDFAAVREWAQRGIAVYGEHAARQAFVDDLHKRLEYATMKIQAADKPKPPRAARASTTAMTASGEMETLVCAECGTSFTRLRTRGRKPHSCPTCRGV
jgi:hypothetical protein